MVRTFVALAACTALLPTAVHAQAEKPQLGSSAIKALSKKASKYLETKIEYEDAVGDTGLRLRLQGQLNKSRADLEKEWDKRSKKVDILASVADMRAIFATAWPSEKMSGSGVVKIQKDAGYGIVVPKGYRNSQLYPLIYQVPTCTTDDGGSSWERPGDHYNATFGKAEGVLVAVPALDDPSIDMDEAYEIGQDEAWIKEGTRCGAILKPLNAVLNTMAVDRDRVILDFGKGSNVFALRFASMFPERFAGLILRNPADPGEIRLGSLLGMKVLLLADATTREAADKIAEQLNGLEDGNATVIDGAGEYPYLESAPQVLEWVAGVQRNLSRPHVIVEPNADLIRDGYWVSIGKGMDPLAGRTLEARPRVEAKVDRAANKITVTTQGVSLFSLLLNDALVDLGKPVTFEINGKTVEETFERDRDLLLKKMYLREDTRYLFTQTFNYKAR